MSANRFLVEFRGSYLGSERVYRVQEDAETSEQACQLALVKVNASGVEPVSPLTAKPTFRHWVYGSGMCGCLFDSGPHVAETLGDAIEGALGIFDDLPETELEQAKADLGLNFIHYFANPSEAGAQYVQVMGCDCSDIGAHDDES